MHIFTETNCTILLTCMEYSNYHHCYDCACTYSLRPIAITVMISPVAEVGNPASLDNFFFFTDYFYLGYTVCNNIQVGVEFSLLGN